MAESLRPDDIDDLFESALQSPLSDDRASPAVDDTLVSPDPAAATTTVDLSDNSAPLLNQIDAQTSRLSLAADSPATLSPHVNGDNGDNSDARQVVGENGGGGDGGDDEERTQKEEDEPLQYLEIKVTEPVKIGDRMSSYMAYKVTTRTNVAGFKSGHFSVMRRFSDFLGLHDKLAAKHVRLGRIVPPAPEKSVIGTYKVKISHSSSGGVAATSPGDAAGSSSSSSGGANSAQCVDFIERRRHALERYLQRSVRHPVLRDDAELRQFLELDAELPRATQTSALSSAGVLRLLNRVGEHVNKMAFKMDESDSWFEERAQQVEALDNQLKKLHASVEALSLYRRDLAHSTGQLARAASMLSAVEEHTVLSRALSQLSELQEKVQQLHNQQADDDFYLLAEMLKDYIMLLGAVKDVFHEREKAFQTWQHAVQVLNKKRETRARLELTQPRSDTRLKQTADEVTDWEAKSDRCQDEFERVSRCIKKEMELFDANRIQDFKQAFIKHLETLMAHQQKLANQWELFLPEVKAIQ